MLVYGSVGKGALRLTCGGAKFLKLETVVGLDFNIPLAGMTLIRVFTSGASS